MLPESRLGQFIMILSRPGDDGIFRLGCNGKGAGII